MTNPAEDFLSTSTTGLIRHVPRSVCTYRLSISWAQTAELGSDLSPSVVVHGVTVTNQADEENPKGCNVEWGPGYFGSMSICGDPQWVHIKRELVRIQILRLPPTA
jgi:hypothetical protein